MGDIWNIKEQYKRQMGSLWSRGDRAVSSGGDTGSSTYVNTIDYVQISTTGDSADFGDLSAVRTNHAAISSTTRGVWAGGYAPDHSNIIDYVTIASTGNAADFGDRTIAKTLCTGGSNDVRGVAGGGYGAGAQNTIDYVTIASVGNAIDFGDLTVARYYQESTSNHLRAVWAGSGSPNTNILDYINFASIGDAVDFGDLTSAKYSLCGVASNIKGIFSGGNPASGYLSAIDQITFATTGNATDFGNAATTRGNHTGTSNNKRAVMCGGSTPTYVNTVEYLNIVVASDSVDFGDLTSARRHPSTVGSGHGGLLEGEPTGSAFNIHELQAHTGQRGFATGGNTPTKINTIQYATLSTLGNMVDFGDRSSTASGGHAALGSATRACMAGSWGGPSPSYMDNIDVIEMAHRGNTSDFGNLSQKRGDLGGGGNATRGVFFGGYSTTPSAAKLNIMEYITISTVGDVTDFGDLSAVRDGTPCGTSSPTRLVIEGGNE